MQRRCGRLDLRFIVHVRLEHTLRCKGSTFLGTVILRPWFKDSVIHPSNNRANCLNHDDNSIKKYEKDLKKYLCQLQDRQFKSRLKIYLIFRDNEWGRKSLPANTQSSSQRWVKEHDNWLILSVTNHWQALFNRLLKVLQEFFGFYPTSLCDWSKKLAPLCMGNNEFSSNLVLISTSTFFNYNKIAGNLVLTTGPKT